MPTDGTELGTTMSATHEPLPRHSVSGFSSGANLALNHLIAYSSSVDAAGLLAGSPYGCNILPNASFVCSGLGTDNKPNTSIAWPAFLQRCQQYLEKRAANKRIDSLTALKNKRVFLLSGTKDTVVYQPVMRALKRRKLLIDFIERLLSVFSNRLFKLCV